ncbi:type I polyketide synthase [Salinispora tropica]|uniref:Beta-ketoacyl synthase n=1 Tax=Salinispora tropica (strain ATCC BAA-916 / DSM 44818 / JCM 13857 / NBRC 105044 / CNB-440) TaxID=369723 RepID=A4X2H8_SALTO|nr:type I polyketide synthase [Salinispora tropica]ABP53078.1 beta-ketoacyl synthase [Salinispora tropica CNB-440]
MRAIERQIAVVGMACRYPDADDPTQLWRSVLARRRAFRAIPAERLDPEHRLGAPHAPDSTYVRRAALLRDWHFDREAFRVSGSAWRAADHAHWLALETARAALADAGFPGGADLDADRVGVVLGNSLTGEFSRAGMVRMHWPFVRRSVEAALRDTRVDSAVTAQVLEHAWHHITAAFPDPGDESLAGALSNTIAGRICNHFDFHGTGYTVDGACASSLLAVITAANALLSGELNFALAGGVDLSLDPLEMIGFARLGALAHGQMRVYDEQPTGFLPGEGCGIVALMRADEAQRRGLRVYARLTGWATSSDGSGGLTRPDTSGQALALRRAYQAAGVKPEQVGLIEGHGTGTAVGDRVELETLTQIRRDATGTAVLGSVKANIGHTKAAAGAAALIKTVLAVYHRTLPPTTGCHTPHPLLREADATLRVLDEPEPWRGERLTAGVSAMGFGGINSHVVVEGSAPGVAASHRRASVSARAWSHPPIQPEIVLLEAADQGELTERLNRLADWGSMLSDAEVGDVAATLSAAAGGTARIRCALVAHDADELSAAARAATGLLATWNGHVLVDETAGVALGAGPPARVGLLLPGQGAPVRYDPGPLARLLPELPERPADTGATGTEAAQPAVVWQSMLGLAWLDQLGCAPLGAVGHSLGELTALAWAGALDMDRLVQLAVVRGRVMARHGVAGTGMVSLSLDEARAVRLANEHGLVVSALNAPDRTVLAGADEDLARLEAVLRDSGIEAIRLPVSYGFHSPAMEPAQPAWAAELNMVGFPRQSWPVVSSVTGEALRDSDDLVALLTHQLTAPVRFLAAARTLGQQCDLLVEAGPGTMLSRLAARFSAAPAVSLDCGGPPRSLALATAAVVAAGAGDIAAWYAGRPYRPLQPGTTMSFLSSPCGSGISSAGLLGAGSVSTDTDPVPLPGRVEQLSSVAAAVVRTASARPAPTPPEADPAGSVDPAGSAASSQDPLSQLRAHLATELELPVASITPANRLLGDLHLNSLQIARTVAAVASALGRQPPSAPLSLAEATVAEAAEVLAQLPAGDDEEAPVQGVAPWIRLFRHDWAPVENTVTAIGGVRWRVAAPEGHPLHAVFPSVPEQTAVPHGLAVALGPDDGPVEVAAVLTQIAVEQPARLALVHDGHPAAAAVGRSVAAELPGCAVTVIKATSPADIARLAVLAVPAGYAELRIGPRGVQRLVTSLHRPADDSREIPLGPDDVCIVTGGATGITAFAAAAIAERTGCRLVVLGRRPVEDAETSEALRRLGAVLGDDRLHYERVDLTDPDTVQAAVSRAGRLGVIRAVVHGAGINRPAPLTQVSEEELQDHLGGKVAGLQSLLAAAGPDLRLVLAFGSIIGRQGLAGQAAYCVSNDWLRHEVERWASENPAVRAHVIEWSVWSGIGMGVRLDVLDSLHRRGVAGIAPDDGVAALWRILTDPTAPVTVLCTAAFPESATLSPEPAPDAPDLGRLRFAEVPVGRIGRVATVTEAVLSAGADPYLRDHRVSDVPLLPAVLGLEAMVQLASLTIGNRAGWAIRDVSFAAPIDVPEFDVRRIRVAALAAESGADVAVVIRADTDGFATDRFSGTVVGEPSVPPTTSAAGGGQSRPCARMGVAGPEANTIHSWYGSVLFHEGQMRRLLCAEPVSAFAVRAVVEAGDPERWFASFLGQDLLLGSPGGHDAAIHSLLACAPHRRVLPVGAAEVVVWQPLRGRLTVEAREVWHSADEYVFDVEVTHSGGPVARWRGLRLRAVGENPEFMAARDCGRLGVELVGPWLSRRLIEVGAVDAVEFVVGAGRRETEGARSLVARHLALPESELGHKPSGALRVPGRYASASYADGQVLVALADRPVGVDWEPVTDRSLAGLLDSSARVAAEELRQRTGDTQKVATTRLWAAREALVKLGVDPDQALAHGEAEPDGVLVSTGRDVTVTTALAWGDRTNQVAVAVATKSGRHD